jgi:ribulose-phosphate 3-epimerase
VVVDALRKVTRLPFDIHLMCVEPERLIDQYAETADTINVHIEVSPHINRTLDAVRRMGKRAGVCINPGTPLSAIEESLESVDQVMVMTINPGWGGQQMIAAQLDKVARVRRMLNAAGSPAEIEIDGGVKLGNIAQCVHAGANVLVCGSSVYNGQKPVAENLAELRRAAGP